MVKTSLAMPVTRDVAAKVVLCRCAPVLNDREQKKSRVPPGATETSSALSWLCLCSCYRIQRKTMQKDPRRAEFREKSLALSSPHSQGFRKSLRERLLQRRRYPEDLPNRRFRPVRQCARAHSG